jgi:hypothetical protein
LEDWKIKISVLWLFAAGAWQASGTMPFYEPGGIANVTAGKYLTFTITPGLLLFFAVFSLVPLVMAFLSLILEGSVHRWANIIVGAVVAVGIWFVDLVVRYFASTLSAWATLIDVSAIVALALIVWYAWKS